MFHLIPNGVRQRCHNWRVVFEALGPYRTFCHLMRRRRRTETAVYRLRPKGLSFDLFARADSSDLHVFHQMFIENEYAPIADLSNVGLVIDCGANVGYSSAWFLAQFPQSFVVAVEPDSGNFQMLTKNLAGQNTRSTLIRAAIWSQTAPLVIAQSPYRDGSDWSRQVRLCRLGEIGDVQGISVLSILETSGYDRISVLKMDIEGAEAVVFQDKPDWLEKVDAIVIELHDDSYFGNATGPFYRAIDNCGFAVSRNGELTICRRPVVSN